MVLLDLVPSYRALFFDAYGVLRDARGALPAAARLIEALTARSVPFWVVTNDASRSPEAMSEAYEGLIPARRFVSSGLLASAYMSGRYSGATVGVLGPPASADLVTRAGCKPVFFSETEDLDALAAVALMDEAGFSWERELTRLVNLCRRRPELELLVPNPDVLYPSGDERVGLAAGALAALLERALGRAPRSFGKPDREIFDRALELARQELPDLEPEQVLMVGDTPETDLVGAQRAGLATALSLWGNTTPAQAALAGAGPEAPTHVLSALI